MRVTVQNGAKHGLTRKDAEAVVRLLPASLRQVAKSLVLCQGTTLLLNVAFHPKEKVVALYWPANSIDTPTKESAVEELLVALSIVAEAGTLPQQVSRSLRLRHLEAIASLADVCRKALLEDAA
jgi:hypothetical protein